MKFHEKLITLRKQKGYTQENLAEKLGVSRQAVSRWEAGDTTPELNLLRELCKIFNVSADYLLNDEIESENEVPIIKAKNQEIETVNQKNRQYIMFSAICFAVAAVCSIVGIIVSDHPVQLALSCFNAVVFMGLTVRQVIRYYRP